MNLRPNKLWALVTDGGYGRLIELDQSPARIKEIGTRESPERHQASREMTTDLSGRERNPAGPASHAKQPRTDPREEAEQQFTEQWVDGLKQAHSQGRFEHLLLVADPSTLGRLRENMDKKLQEAVYAESDRDLTKLSLQDLEPKLRKLAGWPHS